MSEDHNTRIALLEKEILYLKEKNNKHTQELSNHGKRVEQIVSYFRWMSLGVVGAASAYLPEVFEIIVSIAGKI